VPSSSSESRIRSDFDMLKYDRRPLQKSGFPTVLPSLPPLKKNRGYHSASDKQHGETGFGFSALTAEIAKARAVLEQQVTAREEEDFRLPGLMDNRHGHRQPQKSVSPHGSYGSSPHSSSYSSSGHHQNQRQDQHNSSWQETRSPESHSLSPQHRMAKPKRHLKPGRKLKSLAKKRGRRRKKKLAATVIQRRWLKRRKYQKSLLTLQACIRGFVARRVTKRMLQAKEAGVMVAMKGTRQGRSGWYQDFDGQKYFFAVDAQGTWWQVMKEAKWKATKDTLSGVAVLVAKSDTKMGTAGSYFEFGPTSSRSNKARGWRPNNQGIWERFKASNRLF